MKNHRIYKYTSAFLCLLVLSMMFSLSVNASEKKNCSINIECGKQNMQWFLYRIGDAMADGSIGYDELFSKYSLPEGPVSKEEIKDLTFTFETYVNRNGFYPDQSGVADESGRVSFTVDEGWYIAVPGKLRTDQKVYGSSSLLVCVSSLEIYSEDWGEEVTVFPKIEEYPSGQLQKVVVIRFSWDSGNPPSKGPIIVSVYQDGIKKEEIILDSSNDWIHVFTDIPYDSEWTAVQENTPEDKTTVYRKEPGYHPVDVVEVITIENHGRSPISQQVTTPAISSENNTVSEKLPQTGQLWWPVPWLSVSGILIFSLGYIKEKRRHDHEEK